MRHFSEGFWIFVICVVAFLLFFGGMMLTIVVTN